MLGSFPSTCNQVENAAPNRPMIQRPILVSNRRDLVWISFPRSLWGPFVGSIFKEGKHTLPSLNIDRIPHGRGPRDARVDLQSNVPFLLQSEGRMESSCHSM